ncbi:phosphatidylglycerophosphatase A, partial [Litorivicinus sp.]|nr:phosphatidylglycerophosphatase A [Litorivicinus sp.]
MNSLKFWIAVGLGTGLSPKAPGTTGTLGILPLVVLAWDAPVWVWILVFLILVTLSLWSIPEAGRRLGEIDHGQIVIDEWAGMWL